MDNPRGLDRSTQRIYTPHMKTTDVQRMAALDTAVRNLMAHEGYTPEVAALMTEQEALLTLWLTEAEDKYTARIAGGE